jgi:hypothetical protein
VVLSTVEMASVEAAIARARKTQGESGVEALGLQLEQQELRELESWRKRYQQLRHRKMKYVTEELNKRALEAAKEG